MKRNPGARPSESREEVIQEHPGTHVASFDHGCRDRVEQLDGSNEVWREPFKEESSFAQGFVNECKVQLFKIADATVNKF